MAACASHAFADTGVFGSHHHGAGPREIELRKLLLGVGIEHDRGHPSIPERLYRFPKARNLDQGGVFDRPRGRPEGGGGERGRMVLTEHHRRRAERNRTTDDGAEVLGVGDAVEKHQGTRGRIDVVELMQLERWRDGEHALMAGALALAVERRAGEASHRLDALVSCEAGYGFPTGLVPLLDPDLLDGRLVNADRFSNRLHAEHEARRSPRLLVG